MVDKMCDFFCLKHGRVCKNAMIKWIIWNNQHFLFLFGNKCLVIVESFSWKFIFLKTEMYYWMYIWGYTYIVESLLFLFCICGFVSKQGIKHWRLWIGWRKDTIWMSMCESKGLCLWNALFMNPWRTWYPNWKKMAMKF